MFLEEIKMTESMSYTKISLRDTILLYLIFGASHPVKVYQSKIALDEDDAKQYIGIAFKVFGMCERANKYVKEQSEQCKIVLIFCFIVILYN